MRKGRARAALVGATTVILVALTAGWLVGLGGDSVTLSAAAAPVTTSTIATPTTCLPIAYIVQPPSQRVVKIDSPTTVSVRAGDNGTEYDVPIGTVLNIRLDVRRLAGACVNPAWRALTAGPPDVLRLVPGSDSTEEQGATGSFEVVGLGFATISSELVHCATVDCPWSVSVRAEPVSRTLTVSPTSGPPGTVFSISGEGCAKSGVATSVVDIVVNLTATDRQTGFAAAHVATRPDGSWTGMLTVPANADPSSAYLVNASCQMNGDEALFEYESVPFQVTALPTMGLPRTD
jgi:hypothetical protein